MSTAHRHGYRFPVLFLSILLMGMIALTATAFSQTGAAISTSTKSGLSKSNQSKVFYHDGMWWAIAQFDGDNRWYIWRYSSGVWTNVVQMEKSSSIKYDAVLDASNNKLYVMGSHATSPEVRRFSYSSGSSTWTLDAGFKVNPQFHNPDAANPISVIQAKNGDLWIFRIETNKLQAKRSTDGGLTWPATPIDIKTGLTSATGLTDAAAFASGGNNFVGVIYGEASAAGSKFGFLRHQDGAADGTWTDETSALAFFGAERGNNALSMAVDGSNNIFVLTQNGNASGSDPRNTLYKRSSGGAWQNFKANTSTDWKSPAIVWDGSNNRLFVMGINTTTEQGEYKFCGVGQEATLESLSATVMFSGAPATFADLSAPASSTSISSVSGLMVCADNNEDGDIWFNQLGIIDGNAVTISTVTISPANVNANASYTIPLTLSNSGALTAGAGMITLTFPGNTLVPGSVVASNISVNGTPCSVVTADAVNRQLVITTPVNLSNSQNVIVAISAAAGLLNPTLAGAYQLNASTSVQPTLAISPAYNLIAAATSVTPATITLTASEPDSCSNYTVAFSLGAQGRLLAGASTININFNAATNITNGALTGVMMNGVAAAATGNSATKVVTMTVPATVALGNNAAVTLYLPSSVVCNPAVVGNYTLTISTSVEAAAITSNPYKIIGRVTVGAVTVNPANASATAAYTIPLTLGNTGVLTANVGVISFRFPIGTVVPASITASQTTVNGVGASVVTSNNLTREVMVTTPVSLTNSQSFSVIFNVGAGLVNPTAAGDYTLQAWTSAQPSAATSPLYHIDLGLNGSPISTTTKSGFRKSNQSKVFYHDNQWWALAYEDPSNKWHLWKFDGAVWTTVLGLEKGTSYHYDAVLNASANKLYLFASHKTTPKFQRLTYSSGTWLKDAGFPIVLLDFPNVDATNPVTMAQAKNGELWIFRIDTNTLQAKRSSDEGTTWQPVATVKTGLNTASGTPDAAAFTQSGVNYVGVGYAETDQLAPQSRFGFLAHQDGAADNVWADESASLTSFGSERALNNIAMTADASNGVYLFTRNIGAAGNDPRNTLYKRNNAGAWSKFKVTSSTSQALKTPALAIDGANSLLYLMGVNTTTLIGEYKTCSIGQEATADTATAKVLFSLAGTSFDDLSAPSLNVTPSSGLMVCADNTMTNDIYFRQISIIGVSPLMIGPITINSNQVNANATYTIPLTLSANGALTAGAGILNFKFPTNTTFPNNMPASAVKIDGVPATTLSANNSTRQISVTTPVNLPDNHAFTVVCDSASGAGVINPTTIAANYQVTCWTSAQPAQVKSPFYSLVQTTTQVMPAMVIPFPTTPDSLADYTLNFNLGIHGRLMADVSTFTVKFGAATPMLLTGAVTGAKVNLKSATAVADAITRKVTVTVPASTPLANNAAITLFIPKGVVKNPLAGFYTLLVSTSVETTMVASLPYEIKASNTIGAPIAGTKKTFDRNNQSKMFYHGGFWWLTAQSKTDLKWYLWKLSGLVWTQGLQISSASKSRPDCILDASNNKVYIALPGGSTTLFTRLSYASGNWTVDAGYPVSIASFAQVSDKGLPLARAKNGDFWMFRAADSTLSAIHSSNQGATWSAPITVKKNLHNYDALTDAVAFKHSGSNHLGFGYSENSAPSSIFGFLRHKDSDPDTVWTDETAAIPQFAGTISDDHISMVVHNDEVLIAVKTNGGGPTTTNVGLLQRATSGVWSQFPVLLSTGWTRPLLAIDDSNNRLYFIGTREGPVKVGEMKNVALGDYAALLSAPIDTIFMNATDHYFDASVAAHTVNNTMSLLVCNGNTTRDELWYNLIPLSGAPKIAEATPLVESPNAAAEEIEGVQIYPNPFNPQTSFRFQVQEKTAVKLQVFNLNGQLVKTITDADFAPGVYVKRWNGRGQDGRPAASGVYLYRLQIGTKILNGRIQLLK